MLKNILISLAVVIVLFLVFVVTRPADYRVQRSTRLTAPAALLFPYVNNHHLFNEWNPWLKLDPNAKNSYRGPDAGVGAVCVWDGNSDIGAGSATITESKPNELVRMRMDWIRPMKGVGTVEFTFKPEGEETVVIWSMYGKNNFIGKLASVFIDCEKIVGPQFEKGLTDLGKLAAAHPAAM
jgi:hypothetical protein